MSHNRDSTCQRITVMSSPACVTRQTDKCWIPSHRVTLIRDGENVFVITGFLYTSGYCFTNFTVTGAKDIVLFPGVIVLWGFLYQGFTVFVGKSTRLEKSFDTQCDIRLTFVLMSFWHRGYHLCLMSLNVIRKGRTRF